MRTVRTRFAPSPTGNLHIGGARTALFNFLFARANGGSFVLRIDDTDRERSKRIFESGLIRDLEWLGLKWDEGPCRQSERGDIYSEFLERLKNTDAVYPCFCSGERLDEMRDVQVSAKEPPRYDGRCRAIPREEAERRIAAGEKCCWRMAVPERGISFDDAVRGRQVFPAGTIGDFVIARSDGSATYIFASAVDDLLMNITHVIRGDEHIPNTARQVVIAEHMGWQLPVFAHIPMVLSDDRKKLSKRTGSMPVRSYRAGGFLPEALTAYLATLSRSGETTLDLNELAGSFTLNGMSSSQPVHDEKRLIHYQTLAMTHRGVEYAEEELLRLEPKLAVFADRLRPLIEDMLKEYHFIRDMKRHLSFLSERCEPYAAPEPWIHEVFLGLASMSEWTPDAIDAFIRAEMKERGMKGKDFFMPLRMALTGAEHGPRLPLIIYAMGQERFAQP